MVGLIIVLSLCLDCPGLAPALCCGQTGPPDIPTYHVEIVYKVELLLTEILLTRCLQADQESESEDQESRL